MFILQAQAEVPPYVLLTGGAMLLARSDDWDWALLRLNEPPVPSEKSREIP